MKVGLLSSYISSPPVRFDGNNQSLSSLGWARLDWVLGGKIQFYSREGKEGQLLVLLSALSRILGEASE